jgi:hypothetical protein
MPVSKGRKVKTKAPRRRFGNPAHPDNLPLVVDPTVESVTLAFKRARAGVPEPDHFLAGALPTSPEAGTRLDPIEAGTYLTTVRTNLEAQAEELAQTYSGVRWLWYTRRLSTDLFAGYLITTQFSDHGVLEALTGLSRNSVDKRLYIEGRTNAIYPFDVESLRPVARLASIAVALSQCHSWLRRAGKGTEFIVQARDLPEPCPDEMLEGAITTFDERVAHDLKLQWHPSLEQDAADQTAPILMGVTRVASDWTEVPAWRGRLSQRRFIRMSGQFFIQFMTLGGLVDTVAADGKSGTKWWQSHTPSLVVLLQSLFYDAAFLSEVAGVGLPKVGYLRRDRDYAEWVIDQVLPAVGEELGSIFPGEVPADGRSVIEALEGVGPDVWPAQPGPIVRRLGETLVIDIWAASSRLHHDVLVPPELGGAMVNAAAFRFEAVVQNRIDTTLWRPSPSARSLLRGHLRLGGQDLTDIDAVGERDGTLLLVSCKNIPFSPAYDSGEHRVVRNVATTVDRAVQHWEQVLATISASPVGDNFDASAYDEVHGVVVTPRVMYSREPRTLAMSTSGTAHLRAAMSLGELIEALLSDVGSGRS